MNWLPQWRSLLYYAFAKISGFRDTCSGLKWSFIFSKIDIHDLGVIEGSKLFTSTVVLNFDFIPTWDAAASFSDS